MPRFRPRLPAEGLSDTPLSPEALRRLVEDVLRPDHFQLGPSLRLEWERQPAEESVWELFQGRLLDAAQTRQRRTFEAWNVFQLTDEGRSGEPLLALKWDQDAQQLHVVRGLDSYVWEGYDSGGGVFLSRERRKWVRELVGTIELPRLRDLEELRDELICLLFNAVVGTSRLPLAPIETPLPAFTFGELFYCYRVTGGDVLAPREIVKRFEYSLRANHTFETILTIVKGALPQLLRSLFNEISLSPYTRFLANVLHFVSAAERAGRLHFEESVDLFGWLLRQNNRHLTAYDLVTFHHRGANYPDALLLNELLTTYLERIERRPDLFLDGAHDEHEALRQKRLRRRALRQGWLLRRSYEGLLVPDAPTSPGEQRRVLPPNHPRVEEEQLLQPAQRRKRLFEGEPLTNALTPNRLAVLRQSLADLAHPEELRELGVALYLDRPFNFGKPPAEPDGTLLLSAEAFSRSLALQRLQSLPRWFESVLDALPANCESRLHELSVTGLPLERIGSPERPGCVALTDARLAAPDFVFLRTTASTVRHFLALYDLTPLSERFDVAFLTAAQPVLFARSPDGTGVFVYDDAMQLRLELRVSMQDGYARRAGHEYPAAGLWVIAVWRQDGTAERIDLRGDPIILNVR